MTAFAFSEPHTGVARMEDREFTMMDSVFAGHGGMVSADDLVESMRRNLPQPLSIVARWIADRAAVQFAWRAQTWFPCFQFAGKPMFIRPTVSLVVLDLRDAYDDWELARWFTAGNVWLDHASPIEVIQRDPAAVIHAARLDRFMAMG